MEKRVIILARSSKNGGHCVAGIDPNTGEWIRLVSNDDQTKGALSNLDVTYADGSMCNPLDIVSVDVVKASPLPHQRENYLINSCKRWKKIGEYTFPNVLNVHPTEIHPYLYVNQKPYVDSEEINFIDYSLTLVQVSALSINQTTNTYDRRKTKASFVYNGKCYHNISVTDPGFYCVPDGTRIDNAYLVISLPDAPFPGNCYYKFIAKIYC